MSDKKQVDTAKQEFIETIESYDWKTLKSYAYDMGISTHAKKREEILNELIERFNNQQLAVVSEENDVELTSYQKLSRLIRCRVINHNPNETRLPTKLFTVGNMKDDFLPSRVVTFGQITHLPAGLVDHLKQVKFRKSITKVNAQGQKYTVNVEEEHYDVQVLPPLTEKQLKALAKEQRETGRLEDY